MRIDLNPSSPTYLTKLTNVTTSGAAVTNANDYVYNPVDGNLYTVTGNTLTLKRLNPTTGVSTSIGDVTGVTTGLQQPEQMWMDDQGTLYFINSQYGTEVYTIDLKDIVTGVYNVIVKFNGVSEQIKLIRIE